MSAETGFCQEIYAVCPWREACQEIKTRFDNNGQNDAAVKLFDRVLDINCVEECIVKSALDALEYVDLRKIISDSREFKRRDLKIPQTEEAYGN
jgi:hypothetical protein